MEAGETNLSKTFLPPMSNSVYFKKTEHSWNKFFIVIKASFSKRAVCKEIMGVFSLSKNVCPNIHLTYSNVEKLLFSYIFAACNNKMHMVIRNLLILFNDSFTCFRLKFISIVSMCSQHAAYKHLSITFDKS